MLYIKLAWRSLFAACLLFPALISAQFVGYRFDLYFQTTSDWAGVAFPDAEVYLLGVTTDIDSSGDAEISEFYIYKPDTEMVAATYRCLMLDIPDSGVTIVSTKGDWGNVLLRVINTNGEMPQYPTIEFVNNVFIPGNPANTREFVIPYDTLAEGGPVELAVDAWETPKYFMEYLRPFV